MMSMDTKAKHLDPAYQTALITCALLNLAMLFIEGSAGLWVGSAALLADAGDFLEDAAVLGLALVAIGWSIRARALAGLLQGLAMAGVGVVSGDRRRGSRINAALDELGQPQSRIPVVVKRRPGIPIASLRVKPNSYEETSRFEQELLSLVPPECRGTLRGVLWHRCADSGSLEAEPFIALTKRVPGKIGCDLKHLPEAFLACAYSGDDEESAEQAYAPYEAG
jgi:hypothetical protein